MRRNSCAKVWSPETLSDAVWSSNVFLKNFKTLIKADGGKCISDGENAVCRLIMKPLISIGWTARDIIMVIYILGCWSAVLIIWPRYPRLFVLDSHRASAETQRSLWCHSTSYTGRYHSLYPFKYAMQTCRWNDVIDSAELRCISTGVQASVLTLVQQTHIAVLASTFNVLAFTCHMKNLRDAFVAIMSLVCSFSRQSFLRAAKTDCTKSWRHQILARKDHLLNSLKLIACKYLLIYSIWMWKKYYTFCGIIGLNIFYSEEKDWARHTTRQCPLHCGIIIVKGSLCENLHLSSDIYQLIMP